jgi:hypothetical protein
MSRCRPSHLPQSRAEEIGLTKWSGSVRTVVITYVGSSGKPVKEAIKGSSVCGNEIRPTRWSEKIKAALTTPAGFMAVVFAFQLSSEQGKDN